MLLFLAAIAPGRIAVISLGLYYMIFSITQVVFNTHLQKEISDSVRATATSISGLASELLALAAFGIVGYSANVASYAYGYKLIALTVVLAAVLLLVYSRWKKLAV